MGEIIVVLNLAENENKRVQYRKLRSLVVCMVLKNQADLGSVERALSAQKVAADEDARLAQAR